MNLSENSENLYILEQIVEQTDDVFFIYDVIPKTFRYLSPAFNSLWGRDRMKMIESPQEIVNTIHPEDLTDLQNIFKLASNRQFKPIQFRILTNNDQERWINLQAFAITNADNSFSIAGFARDISIDREHSFVLQKYTAKKNSTLEILSHDLAGPLNIIKSLISLILDASKQYQNPNIEKDLVLIQETCVRSLELIRSLVNQEFMESASVDMVVDRINLVQKINIVVENYRQSERAIAKNINIAISQPAIFAEVDEVKFLQVINNLISNAIKFTPENGYINLSVEDTTDTVEIIIEDNGIGIPVEMQPYIFERFTPARRPGLRGELPTGLGLHIVKYIIELHKGNIWFESKENKGTSFFISIPKFQL